MTPDQSRLDVDRAAPRVVALWQALTALRTPVTFMQSGAHPDDETSEMLAALRFRDGIDVAYVCSTRGEGGQNDVGRQAGAVLGALRTAEMERAADRLDMRVWWMTPDPNDPVRDFGFSKSGEETLERWGRDRTLRRFAAALRAARPDILMPTFLDVPGQHGHHRAMTLLAPEAVDAAADPAFDAPGEPWRVAKLYLPAWSGAGTAYDDEAPPPPATVTVRGGGRDPVTGWPWARIGQHSRAMHRTQGMGRWPDGARDFPLHLVGGEAEGDVLDRLPRSLSDIGLSEAQAAMDAAIDAFPDGAAVARHAARAMNLLPGDPGTDIHRIARKRMQVMRVLWLASGAEARGAADRAFVTPGETTALSLDAHGGEARDLSVRAVVPEGWRIDGDAIGPAHGHVPAPWPMAHDPLAPNAPGLRVEATVADAAVAMTLPLDRTPAAAPEGVTLRPARAVVNRGAGQDGADVTLDPPGAALTVPEGWRHAEGRLVPPMDARGPHAIPATLDGRDALTVDRIETSHAPPRVLARPAVLRVAVVDAALPDARVAVLGAGRDRAAHWLAAMGLDVTEPEVEAIDAGLPGVDTVVLGIMALRFRTGLADRMRRLSDWVRGGGTLVTLYHRPWDGWDAEAMPARLEIGQPSLRWRVTDEAAAVAHLAPDHPLLTTPNRIGPDDWDGWDKERGLYFAARWDDAYAPLLAMSDAGEDPLHGALLSGDIGRGRHVHCALNLHHQMEALTPGAFRLVANLVAPRR